jgi:hypothetical protein
VFSRASEKGPTTIYRTEVVKRTLDPEWKLFTLPIDALVGGNVVEGKFSIDCYDEDEVGSDELIGGCSLTLPQLFLTKEFDLFNQGKQKKNPSTYKHSGVLQVMSCEVEVKEKPMPVAVQQLLKTIKQSDLVK